jgi:hypothetical protein
MSEMIRAVARALNVGFLAFFKIKTSRTPSLSDCRRSHIDVEAFSNLL